MWSLWSVNFEPLMISGHLQLYNVLLIDIIHEACIQVRLLPVSLVKNCLVFGSSEIRSTLRYFGEGLVHVRLEGFVWWLAVALEVQLFLEDAEFSNC